MWKIYFKINKKSPIEADSQIEGDKVELKLDSEELSVEITNASNEEEALKKAKMVANRFLDSLAWKHGADIAINHNSTRTDFRDSTGQHETNVSIIERETVSERIVIVKEDLAGNIIETADSSKPGTITVKASEAASYYRRGRLTSDPFDRFRNFYLVVENIADRIRITKGIDPLKEQPLLELALKECFGSDTKPLENVARVVPDFNLGADAISEVARLLYKGHRCQLNHSKALEDKKIPFNSEDEKEVEQVLPLMEFIAKSLLRYEEQNL